MNEQQRPSRIEIDLGALRHNIGVVKSMLKPQTKLMAVVKADAYGHGAREISGAAEDSGVDFLGVALLEEADEIRESGVDTPIVLLYPETTHRSVLAAERGYYISVSSLDRLREIRQSLGPVDRPLKYFLKINSGMNRYGMETNAIDETDSWNRALADNGLAGFTTNLADSLNTRKDLAEGQLNRFFEFMRKATRFSRNGLIFSYEASGSLWEQEEAEGSLVRVGLLLYGVPPEKPDRLGLKQVMSVRSRIAEIHSLRRGEGVGYGFTFIAERDSRVAVIPMGYADGYPWSLSNRGCVLIREMAAPVAGKVCMDAFMVDVTDIEGAQEGDDVTIMGTQGRMSIDAVTLGEWAGSFAYEIISGWSRRMPRIYH